MKKLGIILLFIILATNSIYSQDQNDLVNDQNPNFKVSLDKYVDVKNDYILDQGTTVQETYAAIDPLEEKRILRSIRKGHRANRSLWRHQERMERIKRTRYYSNSGYYNHGYHNNYYNNGWRYGQNLLTLGLLGYFIFN